MNSIATRQFNIDAGILSSVVLLGGFRSTCGAEGDKQELVRLTGVIRDFREHSVPGGHPDFERSPDQGHGLYCGNLDPYLGVDGKPMFTGNGRRITGFARDAQGRPIAPHLANGRYEAASGGVPDHCVILQDSNGVDAFEVCLVTALFNDDGTSTWVYHVEELPGGKDLSHWNLKLHQSHEVLAGTTPGYDLGVDGSSGFYGIKWDVPEDFSQGDFKITLNGQYLGGEDEVGVLAKEATSRTVGMMFVPTGLVSDGGAPYPTFDVLVADPTLGDAAPTVGSASTGGIDSAASFDQWFRDELGVNMSRTLILTLHKDGDTWVFDDSTDPAYKALGGFFPIEQELFGNPEGKPDRNFHFTLELHAEFTYHTNQDLFFRFTGDDDVWVYIDGKLAIDLGGTHSATDQYADVDRFGLKDGETYSLDFFFAERHRTESNFRVETNLDLTTTTLPSMSAAFD